MVFAILVGVAFLAAVSIPFFLKDQGPLQAGSAVHDVGLLKEQKKAVLRRYISDEKAEKDGTITSTEWARKKQFLVNRYVDASRRIDFLQNQEGQ